MRIRDIESYRHENCHTRHLQYEYEYYTSSLRRDLYPVYLFEIELAHYQANDLVEIEKKRIELKAISKASGI